MPLFQERDCLKLSFTKVLVEGIAQIFPGWLKNAKVNGFSYKHPFKACWN